MRSARRIGCAVLGAVLLGYVAYAFLTVRGELTRLRRGFAGLAWTSLSCKSSVDGTAPLHALAVWPARRTELPLLVMVHGYTETAADYFSSANYFARRGWLVLLPDMRGRSSELRYPLGLLEKRGMPGWTSLVRLFTRPLAQGRFVSGGQPDSGGLEVLDIRDAITAARARFGKQLRAGGSIVGYSGGGTSALLAAMRFPKLFSTVRAFFPIVDFARWEAYHRRQGDGPPVQLHAWIGGSAEQQPARYAARRLLEGLGNLRYAQVEVFADEQDRRCPVEHARVLARRAAAWSNLRVHISRPADAERWLHVTPQEDSPLHRVPWREGARALRVQPSPAERWTVLGYLLTPELEIWLGDGQAGLARCLVTRTATSVTVELEPLEVPPEQRVRVRIYDGHRWQERAGLAPQAKVTVPLASQ